MIMIWCDLLIINHPPLQTAGENRKSVWHTQVKESSIYSIRPRMIPADSKNGKTSLLTNRTRYGQKNI